MDYVNLVRSQWPISWPWFLVLASALFVDYVMGWMAAVKSKTINSSIGKIGAFKKLGQMMLVALCFVLGPMFPIIRMNIMGVEFQMTLAAIACSAFIPPELTSLAENAGKLGIDLGPLAKYLEKLQPGKEKISSDQEDANQP